MKIIITTLIALCLLQLPAHAGDEQFETLYNAFSDLEYTKEVFSNCQNASQHEEAYKKYIMQKEDDVVREHQCNGLSKIDINNIKQSAQDEHVNASSEQFKKYCHMNFSIWDNYVAQLDHRKFNKEDCMYQYNK